MTNFFDTQTMLCVRFIIHLAATPKIKMLAQNVFIMIIKSLVLEIGKRLNQ